MFLMTNNNAINADVLHTSEIVYSITELLSADSSFCCTKELFYLDYVNSSALKWR